MVIGTHQSICTICGNSFTCGDCISFVCAQCMMLRSQMRSFTSASATEVKLGIYGRDYTSHVKKFELDFVRDKKVQLDLSLVNVPMWHSWYLAPGRTVSERPGQGLRLKGKIPKGVSFDFVAKHLELILRHSDPTTGLDNVVVKALGDLEVSVPTSVQGVPMVGVAKGFDAIKQMMDVGALTIDEAKSKVGTGPSIADVLNELKVSGPGGGDFESVGLKPTLPIPSDTPDEDELDITLELGQGANEEKPKVLLVKESEFLKGFSDLVATQVIMENAQAKEAVIKEVLDTITNSQGFIEGKRILNYTASGEEVLEVIGHWKLPGPPAMKTQFQPLSQPGKTASFDYSVSGADKTVVGITSPTPSNYLAYATFAEDNIGVPDTNPTIRKGFLEQVGLEYKGGRIRRKHKPDLLPISVTLPPEVTKSKLDKWEEDTNRKLEVIKHKFDKACKEY